MVKFEWVETGDYTYECNIFGGFLKLHVFEDALLTWRFWIQGSSARNYKGSHYEYASSKDAKDAAEKELGQVLIMLIQNLYF